MLRRLRPQSGLRHLRNALGAFVPRCPLRFRPLYATAPFAPKVGAKGLRLRAGCAVPDSNAAGCCATGSVASLGLLSALRFPLRLKDRPSPSMASAFGGKTIHWIVFFIRLTPSLPLARWHWQARHSPGPPRRRTALGFPARVCLRLRSPSGAACPAGFGGRQFNIMLGIMRSAKNALSGSRPHNLHYV